MPTLNWIGKEAVVEHHREVPTRLLECDPQLSVGDPDAENLLLEGDNLEALKALLPRYRGQVKCIYIDPPYNTGNENWVYNDNVNDPRICKWLGRVVGKEAEDLCRHDKWLCMMYPRLALLREFLREDGVILVSIDDMEFHNLRIVVDEIFGTQNWLCTLIWKRRQTPDSRNLNGVSSDHEYVLCYGRSDSVRFLGQEKDLTKYTNPDQDPNGAWMSDNLTGLANAVERPNLHYEITHPVTGRKYPPHPSRGWIYGPDRMNELIEQGRLLWPKSASGRPRLKRYLVDMKSERTGFSTILDAPANVAGTKELSNQLGPKVFAFPKPHGFIKQLVRQVTETNSIVLDSFAGSGTTGQAVLAANSEDGGSRRCVLVELDPGIASDVTRQRLDRVSSGYTDAKGNKVEGLGSGFRYCRLGRTLLDEQGNINADVPFTDLARYVYLLETGVPVPKRPRKDCPLLGVHRGRAIYLMYNGVLGDRRPRGGNVLTRAVLQSLPPHPGYDGPPSPSRRSGKKESTGSEAHRTEGPRVIFGEACRLSDATLSRENIVFRQVPYALKEA